MRTRSRRRCTPSLQLVRSSEALLCEIPAKACAGAFLPVTLEQLARETGTLRSNPGQPCIDPAPHQNGTNSTSVVMRNVTEEGEKQCLVHLLGQEINTASYAMYTFSTAVFIQALLLVSISAIADHGETTTNPWPLSC